MKQKGIIIAAILAAAIIMAAAAVGASASEMVKEKIMKEVVREKMSSIKVNNLSVGGNLFTTDMSRSSLDNISKMAKEADCKVNANVGIVSISCADSDTVAKKITAATSGLTANLTIDIAVYPADGRANKQTGVTYVQNSLGFLGENIKIGFIDTGLYPHPEFSDRITGWNFAENNSDMSDNYFGHGTTVVGIAIANGTNSDAIGAAPKAKAVMAKTFNANGEGYFSYVIAGINWLADGWDGVHGTADDPDVSVISMSISTGPPYTWKTSCDDYYPELTAAIDHAISVGITVVAVAGNNGDAGDGLPGCISGVIRVRAVDFNGVRPDWSSIGNSQSISAPGVYVFSTAVGGGYRFDSGTSYAAPHVAAIVALMKNAKPSLTVNETRDIIYRNADHLGSPGPNPEYGYGLINATKNINAVLPKKTGGITQRNIISQNSSANITTKQTLNHEVAVKSDQTTRSWTGKKLKNNR